MSQTNPLCVGIDVSKATLDIAASSDIAQFTTSNDAYANVLLGALTMHTDRFY